MSKIMDMVLDIVLDTDVQKLEDLGIQVSKMLDISGMSKRCPKSISKTGWEMSKIWGMSQILDT